jgi:hypothetical protein
MRGLLVCFWKQLRWVILSCFVLESIALVIVFQHGTKMFWAVNGMITVSPVHIVCVSSFNCSSYAAPTAVAYSYLSFFVFMIYQCLEFKLNVNHLISHIQQQNKLCLYPKGSNPKLERRTVFLKGRCLRDGCTLRLGLH